MDEDDLLNYHLDEDREERAMEPYYEWLEENKDEMKKRYLEEHAEQFLEEHEDDFNEYCKKFYEENKDE